MVKLLKFLKSLKAQGFATSEQKAELEAMLKNVEAGEAEAVAEEVAEAKKLPTEAPVADDEVKAEVEKAFSAVETKLSKKLDSSVKEMKDSVEAFAKKALSSSKKSSKPALTIAGAEFDRFAKGLKAGQKSDLVLELNDFNFSSVKEAGDISIDGNVTGELPQADLDPVVSRDPQRQPFIESLVRVGTISSNLDAWIETTGEDGEPASVAELASIPQKDWDFARKTAEVKKIGVIAKYSAEMAEDLPNLVSEIRNFLVADLKRVVDGQILNGAGSGEDLIGILQNAVAYNAGSFAGTIVNANHFDVIETAVAQVITALHTPNYVIVHPTDFARMNLAKDTVGQYVMPPFITAGGQTISGVRVVSNTGISEGDFLVGDFSKSSVKYRRGLTLEIANTDGHDFSKDRFTVKATVRLVHRVRENDYEAFVTGSFDTAIASLTVGS